MFLKKKGRKKTGEGRGGTGRTGVWHLANARTTLITGLVDLQSHQRPPNGEGYFLYPEHHLPRGSEVGNTLKRAAGFGQESHNFLTEITAQKVTHVGGANCYKYLMAEADVMASVRETPKSNLPKQQGKHRAETHAVVCKSDAAATGTVITNDPAALSATSFHVSQSSVIALAEHVYQPAKCQALL